MEYSHTLVSKYPAFFVCVSATQCLVLLLNFLVTMLFFSSPKQPYILLSLFTSKYISPIFYTYLVLVMTSIDNAVVNKFMPPNCELLKTYIINQTLEPSLQ